MPDLNTPSPQFESNGIQINRFEYKESHPLNLPQVNYDQLSVVVEGINFMARQMDGVRSTGVLRPSDVTIVPRETASKWIPSVKDQNQVLHLNFLPNAWSDLSEPLHHQPNQIRFKSDFATPDLLLMQIVVALFCSQHAQTKQETIYLESLILSLKLHVLQRYITDATKYRNIAQPTNTRFRYTLDYIRSNLSADLSLAELASLEGLSIYHFARTFRNETGLSPRQFIIHERVNLAKQLLRSNLTISEIASRVGFANQSHFAHSFKQLTGLTPNQFRKSC
ncbi:MAG: AraC family transcriptional regulator [Chloroflexota bacterium]